MGSEFATPEGWVGSAEDTSARYFQCNVCNATAPSAAIEYTALGYPRCPDCGFAHGP